MEDIEEPKPLAEKVKKPRTEKQIEAFKKAQENRAKNILLKKEQGKKALEEKILQKALSIKKKQINKQYDLSVLDQISDDETPMEEIKQKHRAVTPPPVRPLPPTIQTPIQQTKKSFTFL
jgi:ribosomal protein S7